MLYTPFKTAQDFESLIHWGETSEGIYWDYKQMLNPKEPANIAIDMAAFANTYGGTLLIGLSEKENDKLNGLKVATGFAPKINAESIKKQICSIASSCIFPRISVKIDPIKISDNLVVAVNIEPSVNLVGVRTNTERGNFCFPYRTEYGNTFMSFTEVEERMNNSKTRSMYLKLKKYIPEKSKVVIYPIPMGNAQTEWTFEWIDKSEEEFKLICNETMSIFLPISAVDEIWKGNHNLCLKLNVRLQRGYNFIDIKDF